MNKIQLQEQLAVIQTSHTASIYNLHSAMMTGLRKHLESESKLPDSIYNTFVQLVVAQIIKFHGPTNPGITFIRSLAREIATKYPHHFFEKCNGRLLNTCDTLEQKLISRRFYKTLGKSSKKRKTTDSYACMDPTPEHPEGLTDDTLEEIRQSLKETHEQPKSVWNHTVIEDNMEKTYSLQRAYINNKKATSELIFHWPFLQYFSFFIKHFNRLTGINSANLVMGFIEHELCSYLEFFTTVSKCHKMCTTQARLQL